MKEAGRVERLIVPFFSEQINGTDREIIWRLSSESSMSNYECTNFNFSMQHDARYVSENDSMTVISLFDNGECGRVLLFALKCEMLNMANVQAPTAS